MTLSADRHQDHLRLRWSSLHTVPAHSTNPPATCPTPPVDESRDKPVDIPLKAVGTPVRSLW